MTGLRWCASLAVLLGACSFVPSGGGPDGGDAADLDAADLDAIVGEPDAADPDAIVGEPDAADLDAADLDAADLDAAVDAAAPDALDVDALDVDAATTTGRALIDDTAADFGQGAPIEVETRLEAAGAVAPRAYYVGSLCAGGSDSRLFDDGTTADGSVLPATPAKLGLARTVDLNLANDTFPAGVGITAATDWTLWWWGELYLTAGSHGFQLDGDDHAFLELAPIGSTAYTKLIGVNFGAGGAATFDAPATGWYGFRVAVAQRGGAVDLWPRLDGATIPRGLTRCRVDGVSGLAMTGFDEAQFLDVGATSVVAAAANVDWGFGQPADLGVTDVNTFGVRWSGQLFVAVAGTYRLRVQSDDGYRLWVDGTQRLINLGDGNFDVTTGDLVLAVGWHDLVFDTTESSLGARSILTVASGPELVGQPLPAARLPGRGPRRAFSSPSPPARSASLAPALFTFTRPRPAPRSPASTSATASTSTTWSRTSRPRCATPPRIRRCATTRSPATPPTASTRPRSTAAR
ncbi:MAG: hypothetical protein IPL61_30920 [Myxococcales bacterium]|nr:hypothetical protein [Myxococcales bacterium]